MYLVTTYRYASILGEEKQSWIDTFETHQKKQLKRWKKTVHTHLPLFLFGSQYSFVAPHHLQN